MATGVTYYGRINTNILSKYFTDEVWENTLNTRPYFMALKKRGHIESGLSGQNLDWAINAGRHQMAAYDDAEVINITRKKHEFRAVLPWAFLTVTDAITRDEIAMSGAGVNFRRVNKDMLERMKKNFTSRINAQALTQDGNAVGTNVLHGVESFMFATGSTLRLQTTSDTYANQSTATGSTYGIDDPEPKCWSPVCTNYTWTGWNSTGATWRANVRESLTYTKDQITFGNGPDEQPDLNIMDRTMFSTLKDVLAATQNLYVVGSPSGTGTTGLGIPGAVEYDGIECIFDNDQTANTNYMLNFSQIWLDVLQVPEVPNGKIPGGGSAGKDDMFEAIVQDNDITTNGILARVNFRAQLRHNVKYHAKMFNYG